MQTLNIIILTIISTAVCIAQPQKITVENMPPAVIMTIPAAGSTTVNPSLKAITVTFSKEMMTEKMWSFCQVNKTNFPLIDQNKIHYLKDKRTCILPIKLQSGKNYAIWINTHNLKNFRDTTNNPAIPYLLVFRTANAKTTLMIADAKKGALTATRKWLALVDNGKYIDSWKSAAQYFKKLVTEKKWQNSIKAARPLLGEVISRNIITQQYYTSLPNAPKGKYVVIQFKTSFANKKTVIETITPMLDKDGKWRVAGYYIK